MRLAEGAFLALCEALLDVAPGKGALLWRSLKRALTTSFIGAAQVEELIHIPFRHRRDDERTGGQVTPSHRRRRCIALDLAPPACSGLAGFVIGNALPVDGAWPEGEICTAEAEHRRKAALLLSSEACAHHWWRAYLNAPDAEAAYAAWVLFIRSADRRAWVWFAADSQSMGANNALKRMKIAHTNLNKRRLTMAMEKREDKLDKLFLGRKTVDGVGPWGKVHG